MVPPAAKPAGPWTVAVEDKPGLAVRRRILKPLVAYNERTAGPGRWGRFAVTVRDGAGQVVGGLWGQVGYGFLFVELLALGPARGGGLGREVMGMAEAEARRRGLRGIWLDTWTFQAPGFYRKLGFVECGRIVDYPAGHDRVFYVKRLD